MTSEEGKKFAAARGIEFYTSSSSTGENVTDIFDRLILKVIERMDEYRSIYLKWINLCYYILSGN